MSVRADGRADPEYVRPLGEVEQGLDIMERAKALCHIVRVIAFEGGLDTELFERALRGVVERRPLVNTRIVRPPDQPPYFARCRQPPEFTVTKRAGEEHWRAEFERQLSTPVGLTSDPLIRVRVLMGNGGGEVVLSCHHAVCDGRSLTGFCRDLVHEYEWRQRRAMGDPDVVAGALSPPIEDIVPEGLTGTRGKKILDDFVGYIAALLGSPPGYIMTAGPNSGAPPARHVLTYELPRASMEALTSLARANGTTVGGAISAAILRSGVEIGGPEGDHLGLASNIDLRPYLREDVPLSNMGVYATTSYGTYAGIRAKPFWTLAREVTEHVRSSIESLQAHCSILLAKSGFEMYLAGVIPRAWPQFMLANLGRMDLPEPRESFRVRSVHGGSPLLGVGPYFFCSAVGLSGTIVIDVNYQSPDIPEDVAKGFGESLLEHLRTENGIAAGPGRR